MANTRRVGTVVKRAETTVKKVLDNVALSSLATNTTYQLDIQPGEFDLAVSAWTEGNSDGAVNIKLKPFLNEAQTLVGDVMSAHVVGSSTVVTSIDVASDNSGAGVLAQVVADAGDTGNVVGSPLAVPLFNGLQVLVDINTNATTSASLGNLTVQLMAENQA